MATHRAQEAQRADHAVESPSKRVLQRQLEETRESISQTVEEIKDTVADQYESVKETVTEVLDWREQFRENPLVWGLGAVAAGFVMGYSIAVVRQDAHTPSGRKKKSASHAAFPDTLFHELSKIGENVLLPTIVHKVKDLFGVDLSDQLLSHPEPKKRTPSRTGASKKSGKKSAKKRKAEK